ncbi:FAD-dependent monooxygenase [Pseudonocardia sp. C8]|uniref:FAD-dependent monooxygenase n=1 Tax=Pseudonocardia sp. C8 TaxID=2762759 RepID=UPI001642A380|nr:FAD-dependent monooxygenase [Pseudonocardia sp. C8]MBC3191949.1 FAD-dependent monooxygenase [Pseudonocardia sp. C8]
MQFHLDGYRTGDPFVADPHPSVGERTGALPDRTDVLVVGAGPAGLVVAAQLANVPEVSTVVVDRRDGPLEVGQADGVACRTMEMLQAFGVAGRLAEESYQVNEVTFWRPGPDGALTRTGWVPDVEDDLSEMPHVIVNQARLLEHLRDHMRRSPARSAPFHGLQLTGLTVDRCADTWADHLVTATLAHVEDGQETGETSTVRARYVVGCDGARSATRAAIGRALAGDAMNKSWGVLDVLVDTDFPDIRRKSTIHSSGGSMLIIPREGGHLVRLYIELDNDRDGAMLRSRSVTPERLADVAARILHPYRLEVRDVGWWAVYEIGQRLCDRFDDTEPGDGRVPRVFIAGDACHTHSAKAGQGMNVSLADGWNLGWKLATVLRGTARPELLRTYTDERQAVARELIDFDREFATLFSTRPGEHADPEEFARYFREHGRFTAGVAVRYAPSPVTAADASQELATGLPVGTRFHSAPVVRLADARPMQLGHAARADAAWRVYVFADRTQEAFRAACADLHAVRDRFTPAAAEPDSVLDVLGVLQQDHHDVAVEELPAVLRPRKGRFSLVDHEKVFCADPRDDVFDRRGVDRGGCLVLVRPDQYVAHVLPLDACAALRTFLDGVLVAARPGPERDRAGRTVPARAGSGPAVS